MNANAFRYLFDYHFTENLRLWVEYVTLLPFELFIKDSEYSHGSVRDQLVHLISVDEIWFSEIRGVPSLEPLPPSDVDDREVIRTHWSRVEKGMQEYLVNLRDDNLFEKPINEPEEDQVLFVWQVLLHVINHGTDHRAQLLRQLHDLGIKTTAQDLIFYVYDHP
ncbi:MAG: hypothetical protein HGA28_00025 [Anaerolineaceae bacterium]|nr:hypothetical protein [Anaerolineaceae bacterium]